MRPLDASSRRGAAGCVALSSLLLALPCCAVGVLAGQDPRDAATPTAGRDGAREAGSDARDAVAIDARPDVPSRPEASVDVPGTACVDRDGDGYRVGPLCGVQDCDDGDRAVHPGAAEVCNGRDDNCNGVPDEGLGEQSCGTGACRRTVPACAMGVAPACVAPAATPEVCNGADDDCDGRADNGLRAYLLGVSYTADLAHRSPLCDGVHERFGGHCAWAAHRQCASVSRRACCTGAQRESGFGPVESNGDAATIACVATTIVDLPGGYAVLNAYAPGCDGRAGADAVCATAAHRYCAAQSHASGFGPINFDPAGATVSIACVDSAVATLARVSFTALDARVPGCAAERYGPRCAAAVHRHCAAAGYATGFGPVEAAGDLAAVVCVTP